MQIYEQLFKGRNVLVTGGLGFIGSNLCIKLVDLGAKVTILDALIQDHGANKYNIEPVKNAVEIIDSDIRNEEMMNNVVKNKQFIFHLAGQNDHVVSLTNPFPDIDINIKGSAVLLEACKKNNKEAKVIYTGTRGEYGAATKLPVNEETPLNPKGIYELSSLTAQKMFKIYNDNHGIKTVTLRLTNIYGERAQMRHSRFGVANWFIRIALDNGAIKVFGDGKIKRDFVYVSDVVEAILLSAINDKALGEVFNIGSDKPSCFLELAETIISVAGKGRWEFAPFSPERAAQEPGDFYSDITKAKKILGWEPKVSLINGLKNTLEYYKSNRKHYW
ncbi:MAG: NAD-dependent dehydratase [Candidatus Firestonebacteria bacterium RIFOXYC2_FULL_39_67]|nr:MAG: NAD-dependent dehydratase [Candidatus Firestonebacteria bacterium RIFOXYC2_FULL_39_67]OGF57301.1 MAG: NAD-dependent dehydratase [Candidatus Firestonebacteria bacterium RifOxyC12_full_39_7]